MKKIKKNNKGFSLVELIVVVAIMAVLMGVLAPQFLRYVEKSRLQRDNSAIAEIANAVKIAMADETINANTPEAYITSTSQVFNFPASVKKTAADALTPNSLGDELKISIGDSVTLQSNKYSTTQPIITVTKDATTGNVTVNAQIFANSDAAGLTTETF